jgi:predicted transcriptional regulator
MVSTVKLDLKLYVSTSVKLDLKLYRKLRAISQREGQPISWMINRAVELFVEQRHMELKLLKRLKEDAANG